MSHAQQRRRVGAVLRVERREEEWVDGLDVTLGSAEQRADELAVQRRVVRVVQRRARVALSPQPLEQHARLRLLARAVAALDDEDTPGALGRRGKGNGLRFRLSGVLVLKGRQQRVPRQALHEGAARRAAPAEAEREAATSEERVRHLGTDRCIRIAHVGDHELCCVDGSQAPGSRHAGLLTNFSAHCGQDGRGGRHRATRAILKLGDQARLQQRSFTHGRRHEIDRTSNRRRRGATQHGGKEVPSGKLCL